MSEASNVDFAEIAGPVSVEAAFRRVRLLAGALVFVRLWSTGALPHLEAVLSVVALLVGELRLDTRRAPERTATRVLLDVAATPRGHGRGAARRPRARTTTRAPSRPTGPCWCCLRSRGRSASGSAARSRAGSLLAGGYYAVNTASSPNLPAATIAQRLTVVLLVTLPVGYLADHLVDEIAAHRRGRDRAERRSALLHAAALGGRRTSRLDVDDVIEVICTTAVDMGFSDPDVFELLGPMGHDPANVAGRAGTWIAQHAALRAR